MKQVFKPNGHDTWSVGAILGGSKNLLHKCVRIAKATTVRVPTYGGISDAKGTREGKWVDERHRWRTRSRKCPNWVKPGL